ncbi:MAG: helix-turn-helix transcriptional regulator [Pseudomonas lactis]|nr:helix-turn-helix transcriptional regulator [Pseudomonas lactis]
MDVSSALAGALREIRVARGMSQEDFVGISGRTYISELERAVKSPSLAKIDAIATHMGVHPLTLLLACYGIKDEVDPTDLLHKVLVELDNLRSSSCMTLRSK